MNIAAICWLILWLIVRCSLPFVLHGAPDWPDWIIIANIVALALACFSAEKVEDEMINSIRLKIIAILAGLFLIVMTLEALFRVMGVSGNFCVLLSTMTEEIDIWFLLYILLLKIRIFVASRRMSND